MSDDDDDTRDERVDQGEDLDETWRIVRTVGTEEEATVAIGFLNSNGIPAKVESLHASEFPVDFGDLSQVRIRVPIERADEAIALLESQDEAAPIFAEGESAEVAPGDLSPETE